MKKENRTPAYENARIDIIDLEGTDIVCASGKPTGGSFDTGELYDDGGWTA